MKRMLNTIAASCLALLAAGCHSTTGIHFAEPVGAQLEIASPGAHRGFDAYELPVTIELLQTHAPSESNSNADGRVIRMTLPDGTALKGFLYVYELQLDEVEILAEIIFALSPAQIAQLEAGEVVSVSGATASRRPAYKVNLGLDRD